MMFWYWFLFGFTCFGAGVLAPDWIDDWNKQKDAKRSKRQRLN